MTSQALGVRRDEADPSDATDAVRSVIARIEAASERLETSLGGARTVWHRWGRGPALVLLHGGYGSWLHWIRNVEFLARSHAVLVPDMPGLGDSDDVPQPVTVESVAEGVAHGLRALLPGEEFDLVGFSFGSTIAGLVHESMTERTRSLTLVGAGALGLERAMIELLPSRPDMTPGERQDTNRVNLSRLMIADPAKIDALALFIQEENVRRARVPSRRIVPRRCLAEALARRSPRRLAGIWGASDAVVGHDFASRRDFILSFGGDADFETIDGAGHWVAYEAADAFNETLLRWLARGPGED